MSLDFVGQHTTDEWPIKTLLGPKYSMHLSTNPSFLKWVKLIKRETNKSFAINIIFY